MSVQKFLIIRFSSIGDIVLTTPVIRNLRKKFPEAEIHYLTKEKYFPILKTNPYIDQIKLLGEDLSLVIEDLKKENYDEVIDLHYNLRTLRIKKSLKKVPFHSFNKLNFKKWLYTNFKINVMPNKHIVDRYMATVNHLGVINDGKGLDYFIAEEDRIKDDDIPFSHSQGFIAIVIGAAHFTKKLPIDKLKELVAKINFPIILLGSKDDEAAGREIMEADEVKIYNSCGKFSINESADILRRATLVITHDTGLMHIASAFKKEVFSVWGNTVPGFGMTPYLTSFREFQVNKLWCRPCSKTGFAKCPLGHFKCMREQSTDAISQQAVEFCNQYQKAD